jgi:hypothetical protein
MNELTGAFLRAKEKGENPNTIKQSFANAGYPVQDIEEAYKESLVFEQITPSEKPSNAKKKGKSSKWTIISIVSLVIIIISLGTYVFLDNIKGLIRI